MRKINRELTSKLAPYIHGLVQEKKAMGFDYKAQEINLFQLDQYFAVNNIDTPAYTKEMLDEWCERKPGEGPSGHVHRLCVLRALSKYINSMGISAYYPRELPRTEITLPHILTDDEIKAFFTVVDTYLPKINIAPFLRMSQEYKVLFRLLYTCGLRNSEAGHLPTKCIDLENGILKITSKGNKTRLVYLSEDMLDLCKKYHKYISDELGFEPEYFFPGKNPNKPLRNTSIAAVFRKYWCMTDYAASCNNPPTPHDLRFTFITHRINQWALEGIDIDVMMPYLSRYVGHSSLQETYYYYHVSGELFEVIRSKDTTSAAVIPEVRYE